MKELPGHDGLKITDALPLHAYPFAVGAGKDIPLLYIQCAQELRFLSTHHVEMFRAVELEPGTIHTGRGPAFSTGVRFEESAETDVGQGI